jgi:phage shock protein B
VESEGLYAVLILVGLPWLILHYVTKWKTAKTLTSEDEDMLEQLYQHARKLDLRMDTLERLVAAEHPDFEPRRPASRDDNNKQDDIETVSLDAWKTRSSKGPVK